MPRRPVYRSATRALGLDDDDAVASAPAIHRGGRSVLEHFDGLDVVRVEPGEIAVRSRLEWNAVDHIEGSAGTVDKRGTSNANRPPAIRGPKNHDAREAALQCFLDRSARRVRHVLGSHG